MRHQPHVQTKTTPGMDVDEVGAWRREQLTAAGFPARLAAEISDDDRFDLHALIGLVERGCPPPLAVRILAPLDPRRVP
jgi:hypothetical protein